MSSDEVHSAGGVGDCGGGGAGVSDGYCGASAFGVVVAVGGFELYFIGDGPDEAESEEIEVLGVPVLEAAGGFAGSWIAAEGDVQ
jgi:hypothetical protein